MIEPFFIELRTIGGIDPGERKIVERPQTFLGVGMAAKDKPESGKKTNSNKADHQKPKDAKTRYGYSMVAAVTG